jgi:hypothetical protein
MVTLIVVLVMLLAFLAYLFALDWIATRFGAETGVGPVCGVFAAALLYDDAVVLLEAFERYLSRLFS